MKGHTKITEMEYPDGTVVKNPVFLRPNIARIVCPVTTRLGIKKFIPSKK